MPRFNQTRLIPRGKNYLFPVLLPTVLLIVTHLAFPMRSLATAFVDNTNGSCNNASGNPCYCSIDTAIAKRAAPDSTILVLAGTYREEVLIPSSKGGTSGHPFILQANPGVIIDGADDYSDTLKWTLHSGTVWRTANTVTAEADSQVFYNGARLTKDLTSPPNATTIPSGQYRFISPYLYVNVGVRPGSLPTFISQRVRCVYLDKAAYVQLRGLATMRAAQHNIRVQGTSTANRIDSLRVLNCSSRDAWVIGIWARYVRKSIFRSDSASGTPLGDGIRVESSLTDSVSYNVTTSNKYGIRIKEGSSEIVANNVSSSNSEAGIYDDGSSGSYLTNHSSIRGNKYGILADGSTGTTIRINTPAASTKTGIYVKNGSANSVLGNVVDSSSSYGIRLESEASSRIGGNISRYNQDHGIYLTTSNYCRVDSNECYRNEDPDTSRSGVNGIRIGVKDVNLATAQHFNVVDRNRTHHNEDTGIEFESTKYDTSRRNISWSNHDHGFDHLRSKGIVHANDVAWGNWMDGISFETGCDSAKVNNSILANNTLKRWSPNVPPYQLQVLGTSRHGFASNYNIIWQPSSGNETGGLIDWAVSDNSTVKYWSISQFDSATGNDHNSTKAAPLFADTAAGNFRLLGGSPGIDSANANAAGWSFTDATGLSAVDAPMVANGGVGGSGKPVYADRGAYETRAVVNLDPSCIWTTSVVMNWTVPAGSPTECDFRYSTSTLAESTWASATNPTGEDAPGTSGTTDYGGVYSLTGCIQYNIGLKTKDPSGAWSAISNVISPITLCSPCDCGEICEGRPPQEAMGLPAALQVGPPQPNPVRQACDLAYGIPLAYGGALLEVVVFDIAGRVVKTLVPKMAARAGRFNAHWDLTTNAGLKLRQGMFKVRFRIGDKQFVRTLVLAR